MADYNSMLSLAQTYFMKVIIEQHGPDASGPLRRLLTFIQALYKNVAPETLNGRLVVLAALKNDFRPFTQNAIEISSLSGIAEILSAPCVIQCVDSERILIWRNIHADVGQIAQSCVVYTYEDQVEFFYAKDEALLLEKAPPDCASRFAVPTFSGLIEALTFYQQAMIKSSSCQIFNDAWFDSERLFFKNGPEHQMRNSLTQFLKVRLRGDFEVRPEQVVDRSHPVDIKITWWMTNRLALIEIKWLGQSRDANKLGTKYLKSRALQGAKQLADYLESNRTQAPVHQTRGYLVVVDGRRAKLKDSTKSLPHADGFKFQFEEIDYDPPYHLNRPDFHKPFRMFAEPRIGDSC